MKPLARLLLGFWLIAAGGLGSPQPCVAEVPVTLHPDVQVQSGIVHLSDLFNGVPDYLDHDVAQAPQSGKQAIYDADVLNKLAEHNGLAWHAANASDRVVVTSLYTRIGEDEIRQTLIRKLKDVGTKADDFDITFDTKRLELDLPADRPAKYAINNFSYDATSKRFRAELVADQTEGQSTLPLSGRITIKFRVPVLAHRVESGSVIGAADLDSVLMPEDRINESILTANNQIIGRELRRNAMEGDLLHGNDVMPPRLVVRGTLVTLKIETPGMVLTAQGKALQDGMQGETVRVTNTQSNRTIEGTVDGPGTVIIPIAQKIAAVP